jgi:hypothetical protein
VRSPQSSNTSADWPMDVNNGCQLPCVVLE